ncbi:MAG: D-galactonate dehydratase [Actinobacteria bacterium]|nr:D-galactonate dehydratase [Actinomycetota bacterium]
MWTRFLNPVLRLRNVLSPGPDHQKETPEVFGAREPYPLLRDRPDVLCFRTDPLAGPVEVTGPVTVTLWIASSAPDTDFTAKLVDEHPPSEDYPDGYHLGLTDSVIRCRYREGFDREVLMEPGEAYDLGKVHGVPCHRLWGGRVRDDVRLYGHLGGGHMESMYETEEAGRMAELARAMVEQGFTAFKSMAVPATAPLEGLAPIRQAERCVAAMREAVGEGVDIMVDCHARPSPRMAHLFAKALEPYGLFSLEEPCWPERIDDIADVQRSVSTPIATGERLVGVHAFRELLEKRACSVIQPDITHCGGLTEARRIAALAETYRVALAPHNPQGPVSTAASIELGLATPSYVICEAVTSDVPWRDEVAAPSHEIDRDGMRALPGEKPGLGIEIDLDVVAKHPFQPDIPMRLYYADGSVGDW